MSYHNAESRDGISLNASPDWPLSSFTVQRIALLSTARLFLDHEGIDSSFGLDAYKQAIAALCKDPSSEQSLRGEINRVTHEETEKAIERGEVFCDCLVVGTGPAGVSVASRIREMLPNVRLFMIDEKDYRGGQFADEGYNYKLNTHRQGHKLGFPGELEDPHNIGRGAFLQLIDITDDEEYSPRKKLAACLQIDGFIAAPALVGIKVISIDITGKPDNPYLIPALDKSTGKRLVLNPKVVVLARGRGKPKYGIDITVPDTQETLAQRKNNIYVSEAFNAHIDDLSPYELFN